MQMKSINLYALAVVFLCGQWSFSQTLPPGFINLVPGTSVKPVLHMLKPLRTTDPGMKTYTVNLEYYPEYKVYQSIYLKRVEVITDLSDSISEVRLVIPAKYKYETIHKRLAELYGIVPCIFSLPKKKEIFCMWEEQQIFLIKVERNDETYDSRCFYVVFSRRS